MSKPDEFRASAREYAVRAKLAKSLDERIRAKGMAKSYLLLSKNAEWLRSTDEFIAAVKSGERWPGPAASPGAPEATPDASDAS
jgi:hypothetical protein